MPGRSPVSSRRSPGGTVITLVVVAVPGMLVGCVQLPLEAPPRVGPIKEACDDAATVTGRVVDDSGDPVSVELEFTPVGDDVRDSAFTVITDEDGSFSVEVEPGEWEIEVDWSSGFHVCWASESLFAEYCGEYDITVELDCTSWVY